MITIITGQATNLPWWKALSMTDAEIAEYNRKFLKETVMKDDSLNDTQNTCGYCSGPLPCLTHSVGKLKYHPVSALDMAQDEMDKAVKNYGRIDFESKLVCEIWNEAIEAAATLFDGIRASADTIRKLKK